MVVTRALDDKLIVMLLLTAITRVILQQVNTSFIRYITFVEVYFDGSNSAIPCMPYRAETGRAPVSE